MLCVVDVREICRRWREMSVLARDAVIALPVGVVAGMAGMGDTHRLGPEPFVSIALGVVTVAVLAFRRSRPRATWLVAMMLAIAVPTITQDTTVGLAVLVFAIYAALAHDLEASAVEVGTWSALVAVAGSIIGDARFGDVSIGSVIGPLLAVTYPIGLGAVMRRYRRTADDLAARNAELEALQVVVANEAVLAERTRIARDLHDIVAHHVSGMVLHAKAAQRAVARGGMSATDVQAALDEIAVNGTDALASMRGLLGMLREGGTDIAPQPTLADLPALVESARGRGIDASVELDAGSLAEVPVDVQLSAYRITQEALTNTLRHARARAVWVRVRRDGDLLRLSVDDNGVGPRAGSTPGHGLVGMRERAALIGGSVTYGAAPDGGWRVEAALPVA